MIDIISIICLCEYYLYLQIEDHVLFLYGNSCLLCNIHKFDICKHIYVIMNDAIDNSDIVFDTAV